ncbi:MAG: hypothetical protein ACRC33_17490 [Gemmataceae bacterium]
MNADELLNRVANRYRNLGYRVVIRPAPEDLPPFARDFQVEIVATGDEGGVLVSAKTTPSELEADPNVLRYAEITDGQSGWRFDVLVLGPDQQAPAQKAVPADLDERAIRQRLDDIERLLRLDVEGTPMRGALANMAFVAAWATLEAAMRRALRAEGTQAGWGMTHVTLLNRLYTSGVVSGATFRELESLSATRNAIVHGFANPSNVDESVVMRLVSLVRQILSETQPVRQTA